jgi:hypothetical protein
MIRTLAALLTTLAVMIGFSAPAAAQAKDGFGVLVMAHGGGPAWNGEVQAMLAPLKSDYPLELAFGMADPASMEAAVRKLEGQGASRIAVVRLFVSGESFRDRTEQILGIRPGAAPKPAASNDHAAHEAHGGHDMSLWRIDSKARFALSGEGLADAAEMGTVLAARARALSRDPARESVLILAHGPEDDAENQRWIAALEARAAAVLALAPFRRVEVMTLREDWPEKRAESEKRIRAFVEQAGGDGGKAIVIPYRVQGFGPYAETLKGLAYASDGRGLLPSTEVQHWVRRQARDLRAVLSKEQTASN